MSGPAPKPTQRPGWRWPVPRGPHVRAGHTYEQILTAWFLATGIVATWGAVVFGWAALRVVGVCVGTAAAAELAAVAATRRPHPAGVRHALLTGLLVAVMLPPGAAAYIAASASLIAVVGAKWVLGGLGHFRWQPAVVGRVLVQFLFAQDLSFGQGLVQSAVLAPGHLLVGDLARAEPCAPGQYRGWGLTPVGFQTEAFLLERPVQTLRRFAEGRLPLGRDEPFTALLRDDLPAWEETLLGVVPGGIGETCSIALLVVGLFLIYRGYLRWQVPLGVLAAAALAAAILPVRLPPGPDLPGDWRWLPALARENEAAVGLLYVAFHLTAGQLLLGAFLLAGDMTATPLSANGQAIFAAGVGFLTIVMRLYGVAEGECYWPILIMNTCVPLIDRWTLRRALSAFPGP